MKSNPEFHSRRSIRLRGYDYSQAGAYFITICVQNRACLLGDTVDDEICLTEIGVATCAVWEQLPGRFPTVELDAFVVMANHVHGIVVIADNPAPPGGAIHELPLPQLPQHELPLRGLPLSQRVLRRKMLLPKIVGFFKMNSAKRANEIQATAGARFWQRNYYEHIIRNEREWERIREYISANPARWNGDQLHPGRPTKR